jgi:hypothetical protein
MIITFVFYKLLSIRIIFFTKNANCNGIKLHLSILFYYKEMTKLTILFYLDI